MFQIDLKSRKSIYRQVVDNIKELIVSGVLGPGDKLPSVRELSRMITVNPNTVSKAYRELDAEGFTYSSSGLGTFVSERDDKIKNESRIHEISDRLQSEISELRFAGMNEEEIRELVDEIISRNSK